MATKGVPGLRRTSINIAAVWLLQGGALLFSILTVPLISRRFGLEGLGVWLLVQQIAGHFQLLELGLASSLGLFLSRYAATGDYNGYTAHSSSAAAILAVMGTLLLLIAFPAAMVFPDVFGIAGELRLEAIAMMAVALVSTALLLPLRTAVGVLSSQHRFDLQALVDGVALLLRVLLVVWACIFVKEHALVALAAAVFAPSLLAALATYLVACKFAPAVLLDRSTIGWRPVQSLLGVSLSSMAIMAAAVLLRQGSAMVAGYSLGLSVVPLIALPIMLIVSLGPFLGVASQLISPVASQLDAVGNKAAALDVYLMASRYVASIGLLIFFALVLLGPLLLPIWLGQEVLAPQHAQVFQTNLLIVYLGYCSALPAFVGRAVLVSVGKHNTAARGEVAAAIFGVGIGWILMDTLKVGVVGMAYGIALAYLLRGWGWLMRQLAGYFGVSTLRLQYDIWFLPLLTGLPLLFSILIISGGDIPFVTLITVGLSAIALWGGMFWMLIMPASHREKLRSWISQIAN